MKKKKSLKDNLLMQQKLKKKRWPSHRLRKNLRLSACLFLLLLLPTGGAMSYYFQWPFAISFEQIAAKKNPWQIDVVFAGDPAKFIGDSHTVGRFLQKELNKEQPAALETLAAKLQVEHLAERVSLVKTGAHRMAVMLYPREPILRIEADKMRLLTKTGLVYGEPSDEPSGENLVVLTKFFDSQKARFDFAKDATLVLNKDEAKRIKDAIDLHEQAVASQLSLQSITYISHRGFELQLQEPPVVVMVGEPPYAEKLQQLRRLLDKTLENGRQVVRIELDYNGKAFIKEHKI